MDVYNNIYVPAEERLSDFGFDNAAFLARMLVIQSSMESGSYGSGLFTRSNNMFGYSYYPPSSHQSGKDSDTSFARYDEPVDSVFELVDYLNRKKADFENINSIDAYAAMLKKYNYYGPESISSYLGKLKSHESKYSGMFFDNQLPDVVLPGYPTQKKAISPFVYVAGVVAVWYFFVK